MTENAVSSSTLRQHFRRRFVAAGRCSGGRRDCITLSRAQTKRRNRAVDPTRFVTVLRARTAWLVIRLAMLGWSEYVRLISVILPQVLHRRGRLGNRQTYADYSTYDLVGHCRSWSTANRIAAKSQANRQHAYGIFAAVRPGDSTHDVVVLGRPRSVPFAVAGESTFTTCRTCRAHARLVRRGGRHLAWTRTVAVQRLELGTETRRARLGIWLKQDAAVAGRISLHSTTFRPQLIFRPSGGPPGADGRESTSSRTQSERLHAVEPKQDEGAPGRRGVRSLGVSGACASMSTTTCRLVWGQTSWCRSRS